jgi:hypothetical protein
LLRICVDLVIQHHCDAGEPANGEGGIFEIGGKSLVAMCRLRTGLGLFGETTPKDKAATRRKSPGKTRRRGLVYASKCARDQNVARRGLLAFMFSEVSLSKTGKDTANARLERPDYTITDNSYLPIH